MAEKWYNTVEKASLRDGQYFEDEWDLYIKNFT